LRRDGPETSEDVLNVLLAHNATARFLHLCLRSYTEDRVMNQTHDPFDGNAAMALLASFVAVTAAAIWYFPFL
jgi:hypothetical protein